MYGVGVCGCCDTWFVFCVCLCVECCVCVCYAADTAARAQGLRSTLQLFPCRVARAAFTNDVDSFERKRDRRAAHVSFL